MVRLHTDTHPYHHSHSHSANPLSPIPIQIQIPIPISQSPPSHTIEETDFHIRVEAGLVGLGW